MRLAPGSGEAHRLTPPNRETVSSTRVIGICVLVVEYDRLCAAKLFAFHRFFVRVTIFFFCVCIWEDGVFRLSKRARAELPVGFQRLLFTRLFSLFFFFPLFFFFTLPVNAFTQIRKKKTCFF